MTRNSMQTGSRALVLAILGSAALAACGGGSGGGGGAPKVGALADQVVNQATTVGPLAVPIQADAAQTAGLTVTAMVADATLVPPSSVVLSGTGAERTLTLTPNPDQTGATAVTVTVSDGMGRVASRAFVLTVLPVFAPFTQYATTAFGTDQNATPLPVSGLTFQADADSNDNAFSTFVQ
jgi:hypothetical protein